MLLDANILLDGFNAVSPRHAAARTLLGDIFSGRSRVALPWPTIEAFVRISTHPRAFAQPLTIDRAIDDLYADGVTTGGVDL